MKKLFQRTLVGSLAAITLLTQPLASGLTAFAAEQNEASLTENGLSQTIEGGAILHCWCWNFNTIKEKIPEIAAAGFSAIQTSPICEVNNGGDGSLTISGGDNWWWHYQPTDYKIGNYQFGTRDEFKEMCEVAHSYGVKVIVDSVLNHTTAYYDKISDNIKNLPGGAFHPMGDEREPGQNWSEVDRYEETQYDLSGLYELNTQNKAVQEYILAFLKDCVECGADGFRYDAAKLIELPDDTSEKYGNDFASDFWPTILQNGSVFQYGEVLQEGGVHTYANSEAGYDDNDSSRLYAYHSQEYTDKNGATHYMNTTNSLTGFRVRDAIAEKDLTAEFIMDPILPAGAKADQTVTWVESHDNYCNDQSYKELTETQQVIQAWAAVAARKDGTPLFFDRPNNSSSSNPWGDNKIGPEGSDMYKDPQVVAVNFFRNEMAGTAQTACNPIENNNQVLMIERGDSNKGVVIINASDEDITLSAPTGMTDGSYTDHSFGGEFTVENGVLSGTVKAGKVAVVYQSNIDESSKEQFEPAVNLSVASGYFLTDTLTIDVTVRSCDHAKVEITIGGETVTETVNAGDTIVIDSLAHTQKAAVTLTGYDAQENILASVSREYTRWQKQDNTIAYMEVAAKPTWKNAYAYVWSSNTNENAGWPGVKMEKVGESLYKYILPYQYEMTGVTGNVIFNNGSGQQFDAGAIRPGEQKVYTAEGKWVNFDPEVYTKAYVSLSAPSGYLLAGSAAVTVNSRNCERVEYKIVIDNDEANALTGEIENGGELPLDSLGHSQQAVVTVTGYGYTEGETANATATYTGWTAQGNTIVYLDPAARSAWTKANIYIWGSHENKSWPGETMELTASGLYKYVLPYQYELTGAYGNVIFNNGSGQQFDAGTIRPGEKKLYTADGKFVTVTTGDVNGDGRINISDVTAIQRFLAGFFTLTGADLAAADVNGDGSVTIEDATQIQLYLAEFTTSL